MGKKKNVKKGKKWEKMDLSICIFVVFFAFSICFFFAFIYLCFFAFSICFFAFVLLLFCFFVFCLEKHKTQKNTK